MLPPMKTSHRCPKCGHNRILHLAELADSDGSGLPGVWQLARVPNPKAGLFDPGVTSAGAAEAYVCRRCGFSELYTRDPETIPIDGKSVREIIGPGDKPYR